MTDSAVIDLAGGRQGQIGAVRLNYATAIIQASNANDGVAGADKGAATIVELPHRENPAIGIPRVDNLPTLIVEGCRSDLYRFCLLYTSRCV